MIKTLSSSAAPNCSRRVFRSMAVISPSQNSTMPLTGDGIGREILSPSDGQS